MPTISDAYDVVVVGGGLAGALTARRLADAARRVVVLESRPATGGMIAHASGLALIGTPEPYSVLREREGENTARTVWKLTQDNITLLKETLQILDQSFGVTGSIRSTDNADEATELKETLNLLEAEGYTLSLEDAVDLGYLVALHTQDDITLDSLSLISTLLEHPNITVETGVEAQRIRPHAAVTPEGDPLLAIWARRHYLWTHNVVVTGGAFAARMVPELSSFFSPSYIYTVDVQKSFSIPAPLILETGRVAITEQKDIWRMIAVGDTEPDALALISKTAQHLCPEAAVVARHSGWVARSRDGYPFLGGLPDCPGGYVLNGLGAWGLSWVFVAAEYLVKHLLEHQSIPDILALERFFSAG